MITRRTFTLSALASLFIPSACKSKPPARSLFAGVQVELSETKIQELRARARTIPVTFDIAEVVVRYEGKENWMTYDEFLVRTGMK